MGPVSPAPSGPPLAAAPHPSRAFLGTWPAASAVDAEPAGHAAHLASNACARGFECADGDVDE